jgi:hypothetical protein
VKLTDLDGISERVIGWGCIMATVTEYVKPELLAMDLSHAAGVGVFGFLVATGRANAAIRKIGRILSDG